MDSRCRILSARGCVTAPILFFSVWLYPFSTLVPLHRGTPTDSTGRSTSSVLWRHLVTLDTKASLPQDKAIHTFFFFLIRWFTLLDRKRIKTGLKRTNTHTSKPSLSYHAHHHVCLGPERMSCQTAAAQCSMDSSCTAGGHGCSVLLLQKMAGVMTPETSYSHTELLCYPWGLSSTVHRPHLCSVSGLICWIFVIATAVYRFVGFWEVNVLWFVYFCFWRSWCSV